MSCLPTYDYVPEHQSDNNVRTAPSFNRSRSRVTVIDAGYEPPEPPTTGGGSTDPDQEPEEPKVHGLFFRSKLQDRSANNISVTLSSDTLSVSVEGVPVEEFTAGSISELRSLVTNSSDLIEMPPFGADIYDIVRTIEDSSTYGGLFDFGEHQLSGADGPLEIDPRLQNIHTGPSRSIVIIQSYENESGMESIPDADHRVLQWDGNTWISYTNNVQGNCPIDG